VSSPHVDFPRWRLKIRQPKQGLEAHLCSAVSIPTSAMPGDAFSRIAVTQVLILAIAD